MKDSHITVADGRELAYTDIGEPKCPTVFFFHGAPVTRLHLGYLEQEFVAERVRVISPDRPGYGKSSPQSGRSMADWPIDVAALADKKLLEDKHDGPMIVSAITEAFRQGVGGYAQDILVQGRPWPFNPNRIGVPVTVVHGELDTLLPLAHSRHTAEVIPGSTLRVPPGHGHLTTVSELPTSASAMARFFT